MLLEIFQYDFMVRAMIVGFFTAICTAMLGNFIVTSRQAIISDMLAHTALVGVGLGIFWEVTPTYLAFVTTIIASLLLWWMSKQKNQAPEALSMILLTGGLALALLLTHLNKNNPISFDTYLFGSILTITPQEQMSFIGLSLFVISIIILCWKPFVTFAFDRSFLETQKQQIWYEILFMILIALVVGIGLKVIGGLLIGALLVIPALIAQTFTKSFQHNVLSSIGINVFSVVFGIILSFYIDIPSSSAIVITLIMFYIGAKIVLSMRR